LLIAVVKIHERTFFCGFLMAPVLAGGSLHFLQNRGETTKEILPGIQTRGLNTGSLVALGI